MNTRLKNLRKDQDLSRVDPLKQVTASSWLWIIVPALIGLLAAQGALLPFLARGKNIGIDVIFRFSEVQRALLFPIFFMVAAVCLILRRRPGVKKVFLIFFFSLYILCGGLAGQTVWPLGSWHLYVDTTPQENSYYEHRVIDADGKELKYDVRALPLSSATFLNRMAKAMVTDYSQEESGEMGRFLLKQANLYRERVNDHRFSVTKAIRFPPHQFGYSWTKEALQAYSKFVAVAVYKVDVKMSEDGRSILEKREQLMGTY